MKIKVLWGFIGDPAKVGNDDGRVPADAVLTVDDLYGHELIGRNLAKPYGDAEEAAERAQKAAGSVDLVGRASELDAREAALKQREDELAQREAQLSQAGGEGAADTDTGGDAGADAAKPGKPVKSTKPAAPSETK